MINPNRYTGWRVAIANLSTSIESREYHRVDAGNFRQRIALSTLLFLRGDVLGRIADHDRAERVADDAIALSPETGRAFYARAQLAERFHRFDQASEYLARAVEAGHPGHEADALRAAVLQATGRYREARVLRERLSSDVPGIHTLGALASLLADMDEWDAAETCYARALAADSGVSPFPCGQLLFEWGVSAMRRDHLDCAESKFAELDRLLPVHAPGRGHRAEVALARGQLDIAAALIEPLLVTSDDPEYRGTYAEILVARGDDEGARQAERAADAYERLLARRPEAYADHAAAFFMGVGNRPQRAVELAEANWTIRDTPRSRGLLARALRHARAAAPHHDGGERTEAVELR